ncbi:MAG: sorbosone dehydrogenase family protein [Haloferacaceae archaeon]
MNGHAADRRRFLATAGAAVALSLAGCGAGNGAKAGGDGGTGDTAGTAAGGQSPTTVATVDGVAVEAYAAGLEVPWGAGFHDGTLYLTERPGRIVRVDGGAVGTVREVDVRARGEGGLLGLAFHPDGRAAYTYQTYAGDGGTRNRVVRHDVADGWRPETAFDGIPGARIHDGGRLLAREGELYATCGDANEASAAQDPTALNGSVLRLTPDGDPHPDNPFDNPVFTYGHRNPQGLAFRGDDLLSTEHGPNTDDEVNLLAAGHNYGWPTVRGPSDDDRFTDPLAAYTPTIAPGSTAVYPEDGPIADWQGDLFFGTLAGTHLHRVRFDGTEVVEQERLFEGRFGRLRTAFVGPDDHLYVTTSNRDGRGDPRDGDDHVYRFRPA